MTAHVRQPQRGFSLIELMVAITIALIVSAAVTAIFISSKKAYETQDKLARVQENGRFAMHYLMQDIRTAKHMGCLKNVVGVVRNNLNTTANDFNFGSVTGTNAFGVDPRIQPTDPLALPIEGIDNYAAGSTWSPSGSNTLPTSPPPTPASDMLTIRRAVTVARVAAPMAAETAAVTVDSVNLLQQNQIVLIANCNAGDVFQISALNTTTNSVQHGVVSGANPGNWTAEFGKTYGNGDGAEILQLVTRTYYVAPGASGVVPSLWRQENGTPPVELVEGIESLQILYGVRNGPSKQPVQYLPAGSVTDWGSVVSVKIGILARTSTQSFGDMNTMTYNVNGATLGPFNDRHERRVFEATVSLRSMAL